ncbi:MAG: hypothetical protein JNL02_05075 [Saprospiraceae bacterium]|nr:hypothetical protein [Saprospiraceae bacterium]
MSAPTQQPASKITWAVLFTAFVSIIIALIQNPGILDRFSASPKSENNPKTFNIRGVAHLEGGRIPPQHTLINLLDAGVNAAETDAWGNFVLTDVPATLLGNTLNFTLKAPNSAAFHTAYHKITGATTEPEIYVGVVRFQISAPATGSAVPVPGQSVSPNHFTRPVQEDRPAKRPEVQILYPRELAGVSVFVDRQPVSEGMIGSFNCKIPLSPGSHHIALLGADGERWEANVLIADPPTAIPGDRFRKVR